MPRAAQARLRRLRSGGGRRPGRGGRGPGPSAAAPPGGQGLEVVQALGRVLVHLRRDRGPAVRRQDPERQPGPDPAGAGPQHGRAGRRRGRPHRPAVGSPRGGWARDQFRPRAARRHGRGRAARHVPDRRLRPLGHADRPRQHHRQQPTRLGPRLRRLRRPHRRGQRPSRRRDPQRPGRPRRAGREGDRHPRGHLVRGLPARHHDRRGQDLRRRRRAALAPGGPGAPARLAGQGLVAGPGGAVDPAGARLQARR